MKLEEIQKALDCYNIIYRAKPCYASAQIQYEAGTALDILAEFLVGVMKEKQAESAPAE